MPTSRGRRARRRPSPRPDRLDAIGHRRGRVLLLAEPRRGVRPLARLHRAANCRGSCWRCAPWPDTTRRDARSSSTKSTRASAAQRPTRSARASRRSAAGIRCSASRTCRRSRPERAHTSRSSKQVRGGRTHDLACQAGRRGQGRGDCAHDCWRRGDSAGAGLGAGTAARFAVTSEAKAKGESARTWRKRKVGGVARKYFIETFGCQMNFHDSERSPACSSRTATSSHRATSATPMSSSSTPAACANAPKRSSTRGSARSARHAARSTRRRPIVAVTGCVAQQEGDRTAATRSVRRRRRRHPELESNCPSLVARGDAPRGGAASTSARTTTSRFRWAWRGTRTRCAPGSRSSKAATSSARSASCRTRAATSGCGRSADILAEVREAARTGHREVQLLGQIVNHYQAPDDRDLRLRGAARTRQRGAGHRAHSLRQPASAARDAIG